MDNFRVAGGGVQAVERALHILNLFKEYDELGITQMSEFLNLPKGTVHGLVKTLVQKGFLEQNELTQRYRCGVEVFKLGMNVARRLDIRRIAGERAGKLSDETQETVHLAVLMDGMCVNVARYTPARPFLLIPQVGTAVPAHCTATGKVLLSQLNDEQLQAVIDRNGLPGYTEYTVTDPAELRSRLDEVRARGYAVSDQEALLGLTCLAAPIKDHTGAIVAAISVAGGTAAITEKERLHWLIGAVITAGADISAGLGFESDSGLPD